MFVFVKINLNEYCTKCADSHKLTSLFRKRARPISRNWPLAINNVYWAARKVKRIRGYWTGGIKLSEFSYNSLAERFFSAIRWKFNKKALKQHRQSRRCWSKKPAKSPVLKERAQRKSQWNWKLKWKLERNRPTNWVNSSNMTLSLWFRLILTLLLW